MSKFTTSLMLDDFGACCHPGTILNLDVFFYSPAASSRVWVHESKRRPSISLHSVTQITTAGWPGRAFHGISTMWTNNSWNPDSEPSLMKDDWETWLYPWMPMVTVRGGRQIYQLVGRRGCPQAHMFLRLFELGWVPDVCREGSYHVQQTCRLVAEWAFHDFLIFGLVISQDDSTS